MATPNAPARACLPMKTRDLILVAALTAASFSGCVFMNDEDKDFYGKGWVHPSELDDTAPRRPTVKPGDSTSQPAISTAAPAAPVPPSDPEWIVPEAPDNR